MNFMIEQFYKFTKHKWIYFIAYALNLINLRCLSRQITLLVVQPLRRFLQVRRINMIKRCLYLKNYEDLELINSSLVFLIFMQLV